MLQVQEVEIYCQRNLLGAGLLAMLGEERTFLGLSILKNPPSNDVESLETVELFADNFCFKSCFRFLAAV